MKGLFAQIAVWFQGQWKNFLKERKLRNLKKSGLRVRNPEHMTSRYSKKEMKLIQAALDAQWEQQKAEGGIF
jgi:hypothetical protein